MHRVLVIALASVAVAVAIAGAAFAFGTPQSPPPPAAVPAPVPAPGISGSGAAPGAPDGGGQPMSGTVVVDGEVPEADPSSPFTFQIPGCRCHSDDPAVVEEHAQYRLNQCAGCHRSR